jgi:hypothetical protein
VVLECCGAFVGRNLATPSRRGDVVNEPSSAGLLSSGDKTLADQPVTRARAAWHRSRSHCEAAICVTGNKLFAFPKSKRGKRWINELHA